ncbi:MAG: hypothetical protein HOV80_13030 [Polyangiaceae bacterium]|nr:hypothetical protein [Polyangiaceae bacterium]
MSADRHRGYNADNRVDYVNADGSRQAMDLVLRERKEFVKLRGRKRMDAAYRVRAGMVADLLICLCDYPLTRYETSSGHHEICSSQREHERRLRRAEEQEAAKAKEAT